MKNDKLDIQLTFMLLRAFCTNQDITPLLDLGYSYSAISKELEHCISLGFIIESNGELEISKLGLKESSRLLEFLKKKKKGWIDPEFKSQIRKLEENFIYLPSEWEQNENY